MENIVLIGDSITDGGTFPALVESFARINGRTEFEYINLGVSSENTTALTEEGHPFPRPCVFNRLDRILQQVEGTWATVMYGENDAVYQPFSAERFERYQQGITRLVDRLKYAGFRVALMTPTPFDPISFGGTLTEESPCPFGTVYGGYNDVMKAYAGWIRESAVADKVIDVYTPVSDYLAARRRENPKFKTGDGIHQGAEGNFLIARELLRALFDIQIGEFDQTPIPSIYPLVRKKSAYIHRYYKELIGHDNPYKEKPITRAAMHRKVDRCNRKIQKKLGM